MSSIKVKVMHLVTTRIDELYGGDAVILSFFKNIEKSNFNYVLVCLVRVAHKGKIPLLLKAAQKSGAGTDIVYLSSHFDIGAIFKIKKLLDEYKIDILHCHDYQSNFFGFFSTVLGKVKSIATIHGWRGFAKIKGDLKPILHECVDSWIRTRFNKVIAVSESMKDRLIEQGCRKERIELIYNGIDLKKFVPTDCGTLRKELNIRESTKIIGSVGRLSAEKGFGYLLEAAVLILTSYPECVFILVGDGPQKSELVTHAEKLGIKDKIIFAGFRKDIAPFLSLIDVFVFSSLWEGFGLALIEAMALGKPVVATKVGIVPEIIKDGINGFLVEKKSPPALSKAIIRLLSDKGLSTAMGEAARTTVKGMFTEQAMVGKYEKIYKEILKRTNK